MKNIKLFACSLLLLCACTKKELALIETYYGKISISQAALSDAVPLEVRLNGTRVADLAANSSPAIFSSTALKITKLSIYVAGSQTLVADTTMLIMANQTATYKVINSDLIKARGFISAEGTSKDSVKIQFINSLSPVQYPFPAVDVCVYTLKTGVLDSVGVIKNVKQGSLDPRVLSLARFTDGSGLTFVYRLRDPLTGGVIRQKASATNNYYVLMSNSVVYNGFLNLIQLYDNGGDATTNRFMTKISIIN